MSRPRRIAGNRRSRSSSRRLRPRRRPLGMELLEPRWMLSGDLFVTRLIPLGPVDRPFDLLEFQFSKPVLDSSFTLDDISILGPNGVINPSPTALSPVGSLPTSVYRFSLASLTGLGTYRLAVGPSILAADNGQEMNQDHNATPGEPADAYLASLFSEGVVIDGADASFDSQHLIIYGDEATIDGAHAFGSVQILGGAVVTHGAASETDEYKLDWTLTDSLWIDGDSKIDVSGKGYLPGRTMGNTAAGGAKEGGGGSYGGLGAVFGTALSNAAYGDYRDPQYPGSGGDEGAGGGVARIAAPAAQIDGQIVANGANATSNGAGSGGSIVLDVTTLSGTGSITANGGFSGNACGGGGRVAVFYDDMSAFDRAKITATGGVYVARPYYRDYAGSHGSVYFKQHSDATGALHINSHGVLAGSYTPLGIPSDTMFHVDRLVVTGAGAVAAPEHELPILAGSVQITDGGVLTHRAATSDQVFTLQLTVSDQLTVDSTSAIDATQKGYLPGRTVGNTTDGASTGRSGGSHGGLGWQEEGTAGATYGNPRNPVLPGAGSGAIWPRGSGGGAIQITASAAIVEGKLRADGWDDWGTSPGAGGSILVNVGTLSGNGTISATGGWGGGGGGRVAVYTWSENRLPVANVTADGNVGLNGGDEPPYVGSVLISATPYFTWSDNIECFHGLKTISWKALGVDPTLVSVRLVAYNTARQATTLATGLRSEGSFAWDTTDFPDGVYQVHAVFYDASSHVIGEAVRRATVINALPWHAGRITADETWTADKVHIVDGDFTIGGGVRLTIEPGTVVKFTRGSRLVVEDGATLDAAATPAAPIVMTSLADDSVGGDTNLDGNQTSPLPGDWNGFVAELGGTLDLSSSVLRYLRTVHSGPLAASEVWLANCVHYVTGEVVVPSGLTLIIQAGAVVKFDAGRGITVEQEGRLVADGSPALPIIFTSVKDDSVGGDTAGDGNSTRPYAGDWRGILVNGGQAHLNHVELLYGGSTGGGWDLTSAPLALIYAGTATLSNSIVRDALFEAILAYGGPLTVTNSVIANSDRGVNPGDGHTRLVNCTIDGNRVGIRGHNGMLEMTNTIISNSIDFGIENVGGETITIRHSNVWSPTGVNYWNISDPTGTGGNISVDPKYRDAARGNYRLNHQSPAIDAGDGTVAPPSDFYGNPRYDDPAQGNTGIGQPDYVDLGAIERQEFDSSNIDLAASYVTVEDLDPTGQGATLATVKWLVANVGTAAARAPWRDAVYLSTDELLSPDDIYVASLEHSTDLGPNHAYGATMEISLPMGLSGRYYIIVRADAGGNVPEGGRTANNSAASSFAFLNDVLPLYLDSPAQGVFSEAGQTHYYALNLALPPNTQGALAIRLDSAAASGGAALYVRRGMLPTRSKYDASSGGGSLAPDQQVAVPVTALTPSGEYFIMVRARAGEAARSPYTLSAELVDLTLDDVSPSSGSRRGSVTVRIQGTSFTPDAQAALVPADGQPRAAAQVYFESPTLLFATFDLDGMDLGPHDVRVTKGPASVTIADAFTVTDGSEGQLQVTLVAPSRMRTSSQGLVSIDYVNEGQTDIPAPLLALVAKKLVFVRINTFWYSYSLPAYQLTTIPFLGIHAEGPAGILPPGAGGRFTYQFAPDIVSGDAELAVHEVSSVSEVIDWSEIKRDFRPDHVSAEAWEPIWQNFRDATGSTAGELHALLLENATYLGRLGRRVHEMGDLLAFELTQAGLMQLAARYRLGSYGRGVPDPWDIALRVKDETELVVTYSGQPRPFLQVDESVVYRETGNSGAWLTVEPRGTYRLRERDGVTYWFDAQGRLSEIEDPNGNRIATTYADNRLERLDWSNGSFLRFVHNAQGRVAQMIDHAGRTTHYFYDASGEHLQRIESLNGTTLFTYVLGEGAAREHAVKSIQYPGGETLHFEYDAQGRLSRTYWNAGAEPISYAYDSTGVVFVTNAAAATSRLEYDDLGRLRRTEDPLQRVWQMHYDTLGDLTAAEGPGGLFVSYLYDERGNVIQQTDPLGNSIYMTYDPRFNQMTSFRDSRGNTTSFGYDAAGNGLSVTDPSGRRLGYEYNASGDLVSSTNARGQVTRFVHDARRRVVEKRSSDGSVVAYAYDDRDNLTSIADAQGVTVLTHDAADRLTRITYPDGRFLAYTYDASGRRTQMAAQDGFVIRYAYDDLGRLRTLRDAQESLIVEYRYDSVGQLAGQDFGDGTYGVFTYDPAGRMTQQIYYSLGGVPRSRLTYEYDDLDRVTSVSTPERAWTYGYDALGQLTSATSSDGRQIQYHYDQAGNRTWVSDSGINNGISTIYDTNSLNQYTQVGTASYVYDTDGNLVRKTDGADTWDYSYNAENRLVAASTPEGSFTYSYHALGFRTAVNKNGQRTDYLVDPFGLESVVGEYAANGSSVAHYTHGLALASRVDAAGASNYYHLDQLGSVIGLTSPTGGYANTYSYLPFGELLQSTVTVPNPFQYVGGLGIMDDGGSLGYMRARYYDAQRGRFVSQDPLGLDGGQTNFYTYVGNQPISQVDPTGEFLPLAVPVLVKLGLQFAAYGAVLNMGATAISSLVTHGSVGGEQLAGAAVSGAIYGFATGYTGGASLIGMAVAGGVSSLAGESVSQWMQGKGFDGSLLITAFGSGLATGWLPTKIVGIKHGKYGVGRRFSEGRLSWSELVDISANPRQFREGLNSLKLKLVDTLLVSYLIGTPVSAVLVTIVASGDPNDKIGVAGVGEAGYLQGDQLFGYTIRFENMPTATAPALDVVVTDTLDPDLDWTTFELGPMGFSGRRIAPPKGNQEYLDALETTNPDGSPLWLRVEAGLDFESGQITWKFISIDPATGRTPEDPDAGFLPPNDDTHRGEGFVSFFIRPKAHLATGVQIRNWARIVFDTNDPIDTNEVLNTIDAGPPTSQVIELPAQVGGSSVLVQWSGVDEGGLGSGIATYDVYVSENGGPFDVWLTATTETSAHHSGQLGHRYAFYSLATDNVGHRQTIPGTPAATRFVANVWHNYANPYDVDGGGDVAPRDVLILINYINKRPDNSLPEPPTAPPPYYDVFGGIDGTGDRLVTPQDVLAVINYINRQPRLSSEGEGPPATAEAWGSDRSDLLATPRAPVNLLTVWDLAGPRSSTADGLVDRLLITSLDGNDPSDSRQLPFPTTADDRERSAVAWAVRVPVAVVAESMPSAIEALVASWEDILPDIAPDVHRARIA